MLVAPLSLSKKRKKENLVITQEQLSEIYTTLWLISTFVLIQCINGRE
jgi:hypothetical protein